jgi:glycosyltransferase involved in cell wall biosynthesis
MTILIPALNAAPFIKHTLMSVFNQTRTDWTVQLLVDAATTDGTYQKAKQVANCSKRHRSVCINVSDKPGLPNVYKELIDRAEPKDDICAVLDSDDRIVPKAVESIMACYESKPILGHVWSQFVLHPSGSRGWSRPLPKNNTLLEAFERGWWGAQHWRTFRKSVYKSSRFPLQLDMPYATDYNLALVLAATSTPGFFLNKPLYIYHKNPNGITQSKSKGQRMCFHEMMSRFKRWVKKERACESSSHKSTG